MAAIDDDVRLVLKSLAELAKTFPGPPYVSPGPDPDTVARVAGLSSERLNEVVEHLKYLGFVETTTGVGTKEYPFLHVKLTGAGRRATTELPVDPRVEAAAQQVFRALFEMKVEGDAADGNAAVTGDGLQANTALLPETINDAVALLASRRLVETAPLAGRSVGNPWRFASVIATADGRSAYGKMKKEEKVDPRKVFVIHGRDLRARDAMFEFLRALDLKPIEWTAAVAMTGEASPYVGRILEVAFAEARAVVALFTGDDDAHLRPELLGEGEKQEDPTPQPRPNVLLEAGMALGSHPDRTLIVHAGELRPISDLEGRHVVRIEKGHGWRRDIADRLRVAKCAVDTDNHRDWEKAGVALEDSGVRHRKPLAPTASFPPAVHDAAEQALLFNAHVHELLNQSNGNTITLNLRADRSTTSWAGLTQEQLVAEVKQMEKGREISIVDEAGAVFRVQSPPQTVNEARTVSGRKIRGGTEEDWDPYS